MSYDVIESSIHDGSPIELYVFSRGPFTWRFASCAEDVSYLGDLYTARPIKRSRIAQTTDVFKDNLKISFPRSDTFAFGYINNAPEDITSITILRGHFGDPDSEFSVYWKGRVGVATANMNLIDIECTSVFTSIRRPGLRARYEYGCRHGLYSARCGVIKSTYASLVQVLTVNPNGVIFQVTNPGSKPDGFYSAGIFALSNGNTRFVVSHTTSEIKLNQPLDGVSVSDYVTLYAGCDHLKSTCESKFNNLDNFGGFPYIPIINPFGGGSIA